MQKKLNQFVSAMQSDAALKIATWICGAALVGEEMLTPGTVPHSIAHATTRVCIAFGIYSSTGREKKK